MGVFKSLVDKAKDKKDELQKKAARKAARTALEQGAKAAMGAIDGAGKAIERALFGDAEEEGKTEDDEAPASKRDPFAKQKAAEADKRRAAARPERGVKDDDALRAGRAAKVAAEEKEIDAELAALKRKLGQ